MLFHFILFTHHPVNLKTLHFPAPTKILDGLKSTSSRGKLSSQCQTEALSSFSWTYISHAHGHPTQHPMNRALRSWGVTVTLGPAIHTPHGVKLHSGTMFMVQTMCSLETK